MLKKKLQLITNKWFFTELPFGFRFFLFFIRGDLLVLLPTTIAIMLIGFFSIRFMIIMLGVFIAIRYVGEMIYWFSQQFSDRKYRPGDFGFKNLDNHAIYIIYQTLSTTCATIGLAVALYGVLFLH